MLVYGKSQEGSQTYNPVKTEKVLSCLCWEERYCLGLNTEDGVEQLREQPVPDKLGGLTDYQDMLQRLHRSVAEQTCWAQAWLVKRLPLISQKVTCQEFYMEAQLLHILCGVYVPECRMHSSR